MPSTPRGLPERIHVLAGAQCLGAVPLVLRGDQASIVMDRPAPRDQDLLLLVDWRDGSRTEIDARVRALDAGGALAHLDLVAVRGDWRPFLAYLGTQVV
jgi:hypothetical protein